MPLPILLVWTITSKFLLNHKYLIHVHFHIHFRISSSVDILYFLFSGIWKNLSGENDILLFTNYSLYDAYADHEVNHDQHYFFLARPYNSSDITVGWFDCSFIYEFWKQRVIVQMLKANLTKYLEKRTTSIQRYLDRKLCHEKGDMAQYNKLCIYR